MKIFKVKYKKICTHQYLDKVHNSHCKMMNIRHVQVSLDKMKKFANEVDKTQYDYDYVIISSIFIQKRNI